LNFSNKLIEWYNLNKRDLPWRLTKDPFKIWVSEIILQQTRIEQGKKYYHRFLRKYPNIPSLAKTTDKELLKIWEGLGYYSRALNMFKTAKIVLKKYNGIFPSTYSELIDLPGIGDYTASAISSICADEVQPVVDGNVLRFLSRLYKIDLPIDSAKTKMYFKNLGFELIKDVKPGDFNQAMMDFGSTVCKPRKSDCKHCMFSSNCKAYNSNSVMSYPFKKKKIKIKHRYLNYVVVISDDNKTRINKRDDSGIWKNLYEFPLIETETETSANEIIKKLDIDFLKLKEVKKTKHKLSHQLLHITFFTFKVGNTFDDYISIESLSKYPFPRPINKFISELV
tara:strand:+ start:2243 stop:3256 length:1014 start_codon:yes stop_codon:yes gene_type:complete